LLIIVGLFACTTRGSQQVATPSSVSASGGLSGIAFPSPLVVSVLYFDDRTKTPELMWMRKGLADMLVSSLARNPGIVVVQRERLDEILREQTLHLSGRVPDESVVRAGRLTGATVLLAGTVTQTQGLLRIDAQLTGVESGEVLGSATAEGRTGDVMAVANALLRQVTGLLPSKSALPAAGDSPPAGGLISAVQANEAGEVFRRQGKLFEALAEFERAMKIVPDYTVARSNFDRVVRGLSGAELLRAPAGEQGRGTVDHGKTIDRIIERLTTLGVQSVLGPARMQGGQDGTVLRIPVTLRLDPEAVKAVGDVAGMLKGGLRPLPDRPGAYAVRLSSQAGHNRVFIKSMSRPFRVYLRLLTGNGRTVAVFSHLKDWRLSSWLTPADDQHLIMAAEKVVHTEAVLPRLTREQIGQVASAQVTVDPVPQERTSVRLDLPDGESWDGLSDLQRALEDAWSPVLLERAWAPGYLPANQRTAVVAVMTMERLQAGEAARIVRGSGDADFDQEALGAVRRAIEGRRITKDSSMSRELKLRASFSLREDIPALNLIGPLEQTTALALPPSP
jgi:TolB-like protein